VVNAPDLVFYVLMALYGWVEPANPNIPAQDTSHFHTLTNAIVATCGDPSEDPLPQYSNSYTPSSSIYHDDVNRYKGCVLMASIAFMETHLYKHIFDGHCGLMGRWECDYGHSFTPWQFYVQQGGYCIDQVLWHYCNHGINGPDLVKSPELAAKLAYHMLRNAPNAWTTYKWAKPFADSYIIAHPYPY
jgi:hypothetical protein